MAFSKEMRSKEDKQKKTPVDPVISPKISAMQARERKRTPKTLPFNKILDEITNLGTLITNIDNKLDNISINSQVVRLKAPYNKYAVTQIRGELIQRNLSQDGRYKNDFVTLLNLHDKVLESGLIDDFNQLPNKSRKNIKQLLVNKGKYYQ